MNIETPWDPSSRHAGGAAAAEVAASAGSAQSAGADPIDVAAASSRGRSHAINEDAHSPLAPGSTLYVVADGVGGGAMAATASRELVSQLHATLDGRRVDAGAVRRALREADRQISGLIAERTAAAGAATVALCCRSESPGSWLIAWVGDCRIYRIAGLTAPAELLSIDDTYARLGEAPPAGGSGDDPARMVGNGAVGDPNPSEVALQPCDVLLLCSDGVHKHVHGEDIAQLMRSRGSLAERCERLVELARTRGSHDDATVLAVQPQRPAARRGAARALAALLLVLLLLAGGWRWWSGRAPEPAPVVTLAPAAEAPASAPVTGPTTAMHTEAAPKAAVAPSGAAAAKRPTPKRSLP